MIRQRSLTCIYLVLFTASAMAQTSHFGQQQPAPHQQSLPAETPHSPIARGVPSADRRGSRTEADLPDGTAAVVTLVEPFIVPTSNVGGPVSPALQAQLEAEEALMFDNDIAGGTSRALLHGPNRPKAYPQCSDCRIIRCAMGVCSGHCRKNLKMHKCNNNNIASPLTCIFPTLKEVQGRPPDDVDEYDTVVVSAEAPYIGCADIGNRPSACPASGTRGMLPGGEDVTVIASFCRTEYYVPDCGSPLLPFGACECFYSVSGGSGDGGPGTVSFSRTACSTAVLEAGFGVGGADGSLSDDGVAVRPSGSVTQTWFSDLNDPDGEPMFSYSVNASVRTIDVEVSLDIYPALVASGVGVTVDDYSDYVISEDYEELYTPNGP